ncbi:MAG TPA: transposase [Abditibacteriaceae bacterium]
MPKPSAKGGRSPADNRAVVEGILWVLKTGARWRDLPPRYPSPSTCWRRLRDWEEQGVWLKVWHSFIAELDEANHLDGGGRWQRSSSGIHAGERIASGGKIAGTGVAGVARNAVRLVDKG